MTETEWLAATEPRPMLEFLGDKVNDRKMRLFAVACVERIADLVTTNRVDRLLVQEAISVTELYADKLASDEELDAAKCGVEEAISNTSWVEWAGWAIRAAIDMATRQGCVPFPHNVATNAARAVAAVSAYSARIAASGEPAADWSTVNARGRAMGEIEARAKHADLLRDIFGNPFHPVAVHTSLLTSRVLSLASAIYEEKAFDRMPILTDALQDAGCDNEEILQHCRGEAVHVRGCWVIDLLTGRK